MRLSRAWRGGHEVWIGRRRNSVMLILTRRVCETVMIGDEIAVTVLGLKGNQVRVGINAPKSVAVHRSEVYERIKRAQQGESQGEPGQQLLVGPTSA